MGRVKACVALLPTLSQSKVELELLRKANPELFDLQCRGCASVETPPDVAIDHVARQTQMDVVWYILPLVMD